MIENRAIGIKSRELYEAPAAIALIEAHRALEDVVSRKQSDREARARAEVGEGALRRALVQPGPVSVRRLLRGYADARHG